MVAGFGADNFPVELDGAVLERTLLAPTGGAVLPEVPAFDPNITGKPPDWLTMIGCVLWSGSVDEI